VVNIGAQGEDLSGFVGEDTVKGNGKGNADPGYVQRVKIQASEGVAESQYLLGLLKLYGIDGEKQDIQAAFKLFSKASMQGNLNAQTNLGIMYVRGIGTAKNVKSAARWFEEAAMSGHSDAQWMLGRLYYDGLIGLSPSMKPDFKTALKWFIKSSERSNNRGSFNVGVMYEYGLGGLEQHLERASEFYAIAAKGGDAEAAYYLGVMYLYGRGMKQDFKRGVPLIRTAADAGYGPAMNMLGKLFTHGQGVERDYRLAVAWFDRTVKSSNDDSPICTEARKSRDEIQSLIDESDKQMFDTAKNIASKK